MIDRLRLMWLKLCVKHWQWRLARLIRENEKLTEELNGRR